MTLENSAAKPSWTFTPHSNFRQRLCGSTVETRAPVKFSPLLSTNSGQILKKGVPWATAHCRFRAEEDREQYSGVLIGSVRERRSDRLLRSSRACLPRVISKWPMSRKRLHLLHTIITRPSPASPVTSTYLQPLCPAWLWPFRLHKLAV